MQQKDENKTMDISKNKYTGVRKGEQKRKKIWETIEYIDAWLN